MKTIVFLMLAMAGPLLAADVSLLTKPRASAGAADVFVAVTNGQGVALVGWTNLAAQWTNTARSISATNNTTGNAATATVASYVDGPLTNPVPSANLTGGITSSATSNVLSVADDKTVIANGRANTLVVTNGQVGIRKVPTLAWSLDVDGSFNATYVNSGGSVLASAGSVFQHSGRNRWYSPADGTMTWTKADGTTILMSNTNGTLTVSGTFISRATDTTAALKSFGTNNAILTAPDGGTWILRVGNDGTLSTVTNTAGL